jgi:hypothetical protein
VSVARASRAAAAWSTLLLALLPAALFAQVADSTATLRVRVTDALTGNPLAAARVGFPELNLFQLSNANGVAQIAGVPAGIHNLEVTMFGYGRASATLMLEARDVASGSIALTAEPIEIQGIEILGTARRKRLEDVGFYTRPRFAAGFQLGPLEIASELAFMPSDLFRTAPGVERIPDGNGRADIISRRDCGSFRNRDQRIAIFLDGVPYYEEIDRLPIDAIEAVELYMGVNVPLQFATVNSGGCGVILLWTR